jgi:hypothetical protein
MPQVRIFPPLAGVSEDSSFTDQEPMTARDAENVVGVDPDTGRTRLSKRPGLKRFLSSAVGTGKVFEVAQLIYNNLQIDYTGIATSITAAVWQSGPYTKSGPRSVWISPRGDLFILENASGNTVTRINQDGVVLNAIPLENDEAAGSGPYFYTLQPLDDDSFVVGISESATGGTDSYIRMLRYALGEDGEYRKTWELRNNAATPDNVELVMAMDYKNGLLYTIQEGQSGTPAVTVRVYGNILGNTKPSLELEVELLAGAGSNRGSDIAADEFGNIFCAFRSGTTNYTRKLEPTGVTAVTYDDSGTNIGGHGVCVAARDGSFWTAGLPNGASGSPNGWINKYDDATTPTLDWTYSGDPIAAENVNFRKIVVDAFGNVWSPYLSTVAAGGGESIVGVDVDGVKVVDIGDTNLCAKVAIPTTNPDYTGSVTPPDRPEFLYTTTLIGTNGTVIKYALVTAEKTSGSPRSVSYVAVVDDDIKTFTSSAVSNPTGGANVIASTVTYAQSAQLYGKLYITDGESYFEYDPVEDAVTALESNTSGLIPRRCALIEEWRSRIVLAGDPDNPHAIYWSAQGDPRDWDFYPPSPSSTQAVWTTTAPQLDAPADLVTALFPYSNDWLLVGGDHSVSLVRGDPAAGGTLDLISRQIGMAFGRSACFGPNGEVFFVSQQGSVYVMGAGLGQMQSISDDRIGRELRDIDLSTYYPRVAWSHRFQGLLLVYCPYGAGGTSQRGYFWSAKYNAWWPLRFGTTSATGVQPTSMIVSDADDPADRVILFGCEDGYVRRYDEAAGYDEASAGTLNPIGSYVLTGSFMSEERTRQVKAREMWATLTSNAPLEWQFYTVGRPDDTLTQPSASGQIRPGYNARIPIRRKGLVTYLKLLDNSNASSFGLESLALELEVGDKERRRL